MPKLAIHAGKVITPLEEIPDCIVLVEDSTITAVGREIDVPAGAQRIDARHHICVPGFIDLHIHGAGGHDLMEGSPEAFTTVGRTLAVHGVTSYFPTTVTSAVPTLVESLARLGAFIHRTESMPPSDLQAQPLGIHMEGPFINPVRKGVHPVQHIIPPSAELFDSFHEASGGTLRLITMAPEVEGAEPVVKHAFSRGVRVGMGHTDATWEQAARAADLGIRHVIHMFNAMRPFSHRDPGVIAAALLDERISTELIADGVHVLEAPIRLLARMKGPDGILLVSDGLAATGMPDGDYTLGEFEIVVKGPLACNRAGVIAGSVLTLDVAVKNVMRFTGLSLADIVKMVTINQARLMGLANKGRIAPGADADLVLLTGSLDVAAVCARGRIEEFHMETA
jgi:N-acetylglucosamine-6-phosphate deacetylase